MADHPRIRVFS